MANSANTTNLSRRLMMLRTGAAVAATACLPAAVLATMQPASAQTVMAPSIDPVLKALGAYWGARDDMNAIADPYDDDAIDAASDRLMEARRAILYARPTTHAGAVQLARFTANEASKEDRDLGVAIDTICAFLVNAVGTSV
jgi:hypothetical protein